MPGPQVLFPAFLILTVALLGIDVYTGLKAKLAAHLTFVVITVASLVASIWFALKLGELYDLASAGWITPVHLKLARVATYAYVLPTVSGIMTLRDRKHRRLHFRLAMLTLALTVLAALTGTWMILAAQPLPAQP